MKIRQEILEKLNVPTYRLRLAQHLGVTEQTIYRHLVNNSSDGELTKMKPLMAISEEIGVPVTEILEEEAVPAKA
jgi:predicted transcriptional regulator